MNSNLIFELFIMLVYDVPFYNIIYLLEFVRLYYDELYGVYACMCFFFFGLALGFQSAASSLSFPREISLFSRFKYCNK